MNKGNFIADLPQSKIVWTGRKVTGEHTGTINIASGFVEADNSQIKGGRFEIDMTSIVITDIKDREANQQFAGHLASNDFFSSVKYPVASFVITNATLTDGTNYLIDGNLTIKDISQSQSFSAVLEFTEKALTMKAKIIVDRTKFGIRFRSGSFFQNLGDNLIYNDFILEVSLTATKS
jgi:polyisoprenoid-binding protein YceI